MLNIESDIQQEDAFESERSNPLSLLDMMLNPGAVANIYLRYCIIQVHRDNLIEDSLNILSDPHLNFKKELKVKFIGEQGVDAGGVAKEFFQLIVKNIFDPSYSMFNYNQETRTYWFNSETFEPPIKFELIGLIIGLALYNSVILDIHFPRVVYKKLLEAEWNMEDLHDFSPSIAKSIEHIINYKEEDLEEVFACTFSVDVESYGNKKTIELIPGGASVYITQENKEMYAKKYMEWLFDKSIEPLFASFKKGFYKLYNGEFTTNCYPEELELMICGSPVLDFLALERNTTYEGGYYKNSPIIK